MVSLSVAALSLIVASAYILIGLLVMPGLRLDPLALVGAGLFFVGCALTHLHLGADILVGYGFNHGVVYQLVFHVMQVVGAVVFVGKMAQKRLVVRLEDES